MQSEQNPGTVQNPSAMQIPGQPAPEVYVWKWISFDNQVFQARVASRNHGLWWSHSLHRMFAQGHQAFDSEQEALVAGVASTRKEIEVLQGKLALLEPRLK